MLLSLLICYDLLRSLYCPYPTDSAVFFLLSVACVNRWYLTSLRTSAESRCQLWHPSIGVSPHARTNAKEQYCWVKWTYFRGVMQVVGCDYLGIWSLPLSLHITSVSIVASQPAERWPLDPYKSVPNISRMLRLRMIVDSTNSGIKMESIEESMRLSAIEWDFGFASPRTMAVMMGGKWTIKADDRKNISNRESAPLWRARPWLGETECVETLSCLLISIPLS